MDILLRRPARLDEWEHRPLWPAIADGPGPRDHRDVYEAEVAREPPGPPLSRGPFRAVADAILAYRIFPSSFVTGVLRRSPVELGDTVGIRYHLPLGVDLFFAARVVARFDGADGPRWRTGFTYQTLVGHPELGEETFAVEKSVDDGRISASLRSWSRPGTWLAKLGAPVVRRLQVGASRAALRNLRQIAQAADGAMR